MTKNKSTPLSSREARLIDQLRTHPELLERFEAILQISGGAEGSILQADEVEALVIDATRRLGNAALGSWAARTEERLVRQFKAEHPTARARKKKH